VATLIGYFPGYRMGFGGLEARQVIKDWAHNARTGNYAITNSPHDFEALLGKIVSPVLAISFDGDGLAPQGTVRHLCKKMENARVTYVHMIPAPGETGFTHFNWLRRPQPLMPKIDAWLSALPSSAVKPG